MPAMTLNLPDAEWDILTRLSVNAFETKTAVIRKSLLLYADVMKREAAGARLFVETADGVRTELVVL